MDQTTMDFFDSELRIECLAIDTAIERIADPYPRKRARDAFNYFKYNFRIYTASSVHEAFRRYDLLCVILADNDAVSRVLKTISDRCSEQLTEEIPFGCDFDSYEDYSEDAW